MKTVEDILNMNRNGNTRWFVTPDTDASRALKLMAGNQLSVLPVFDEGMFVGIISEDDCINKGILPVGISESKTIGEIMTHNFLYSFPGQTIEDCLDVMIENKIHHLPVIADDALVGFISISDLLRTIVRDQKNYIYHLEKYVMGIGFT